MSRDDEEIRIDPVDALKLENICSSTVRSKMTARCAVSWSNHASKFNELQTRLTQSQKLHILLMGLPIGTRGDTFAYCFPNCTSQMDYLMEMDLKLSPTDCYHCGLTYLLLFSRTLVFSHKQQPVSRKSSA